MDKDEKLLREYESVLKLMQDTGQSIWVINGAYIVAASVFLGSLVKEFAGGRSPLLVVILSLIGVAISILWWFSFERNYEFYNLRIRYAKHLEGGLGFWLIRMGALIGEKEPFVISCDATEPNHFQRAVERFEENPVNVSSPFPLNTLDVRFDSMQGLTRTLILLFILAFLGFAIAVVPK